MTFYESHETFPGARGGVWHLHHVPAGKQRAAAGPWFTAVHVSGDRPCTELEFTWRLVIIR